MPKMVVINKGLHYAGQSYNVGDRYEATHVDAGWQKKTLRADLAPADPVPMREAASVRPAQLAPDLEIVSETDVEFEASGADEAEVFETPARRAYRRRDLKAEDAPRFVEGLLKAYVAHRTSSDETFLAFSRRHDGETLKTMADAEVAA